MKPWPSLLHLDTRLSTPSTSLKTRTPSRTSISTPKQWFERQIRDPYVKLRQQSDYRSRAAFKLIEIQKSHKIFKYGMAVLDLGAAPGSWSQVALEYIADNKPPTSDKPPGRVIGVDLQAIDLLPGATFIQGDILCPKARDQIKALIPDGQHVDVVISDMACPSMGLKAKENAVNNELFETARDTAMMFLKQRGTFVCKFFQGSFETDQRRALESVFKKVSLEKPAASRSTSSENYFVATGFRTRGNNRQIS
ncbi:hypothetical protein SmJEL517_g05817 [Synchytrium microbalum]|uniref:rRNA methyltransferase 2, mitochondrial n=1 Tax=Synchytrium microbalum TaxID=1806994 RepID=A0A507BTM0_9FUNG|nr:uncharacterized protein SmJEL517_g05817 [Synchytrium microbalum]TPX30678.1 hypothetical protein SmJEL517_g05817 [Synchytrium microbalum]